MPLSSTLRRGLAVLTASACAIAGLTTLAPTADAASASVVINEFYGRGGSANQPYTHKFVELYNPTNADVSLNGTSLQYRSATGTANATGVAALAGTVKAGGYFLIQLNSNGSTGQALPKADVETGLAPSGTTGTIFLANTTVATNPDNLAVVIDKLGFGESNSPETAAVAYPGSNSTPGSLNRTNGVDTDDNSKDFTFSAAVTPQNSGGSVTDPDPDPEPEPTIVPIKDIQGTGASTPLAGQKVVTQGVVTAAYPTGGFGGVYIQAPGSGGTAKRAGEASDGIFVYSNWAATNLTIGDCVKVQGTAGEYNGLTQLSENPFVTRLEASECAPVVATPLASLPTDAEKEAMEGMLVLPLGTYTITNNYELNRFGQLGLTPGTEPLYTATEVVAPAPRRSPTRPPTRPGSSPSTTARRGTTRPTPPPSAARCRTCRRTSRCARRPRSRSTSR